MNWKIRICIEKSPLLVKKCVAGGLVWSSGAGQGYLMWSWCRKLEEIHENPVVSVIFFFPCFGVELLLQCRLWSYRQRDEGGGGDDTVWARKSKDHGGKWHIIIILKIRAISRRNSSWIPNDIDESENGNCFVPTKSENAIVFVGDNCGNRRKIWGKSL